MAIGITNLNRGGGGCNNCNSVCVTGFKETCNG